VPEVSILPERSNFNHYYRNYFHHRHFHCQFLKDHGENVSPLALEQLGVELVVKIIFTTILL